MAANTHVLITSKKVHDIETAFDQKLLLNKEIMAIEDPKVDADVRLHVLSWIEKNAPYNEWSQEIQDLITSEVTKRSNGVFRWVECQLNTLSLAVRECDVEEALQQLPKDLDETYERMLNNTTSTPYAKETWRLFHRLSFSERQLTVMELADAIAFVTKEQDSGRGYSAISFNRNRRFRSFGNIIQSAFFQLLIITSENHVVFSHYSVLEYLMCDRVNVKFQVRESAAHLLMLESSLIYILGSVEQSDDTSNRREVLYL